MAHVWHRNTVGTMSVYIGRLPLCNLTLPPVFIRVLEKWSKIQVWNMLSINDTAEFKCIRLWKFNRAKREVSLRLHLHNVNYCNNKLTLSKLNRFWSCKNRMYGQSRRSTEGPITRFDLYQLTKYNLKQKCPTYINRSLTWNH